MRIKKRKTKKKVIPENVNNIRIYNLNYEINEQTMD